MDDTTRIGIENDCESRSRNDEVVSYIISFRR